MQPTPERPLRVAIVGCGPSGFYAAEALLKKNIPVEISMIDRLPAPFGLVRYGVAPDHDKIKNVTKVFERTLSRPEVRFYGCVNVGKDVFVPDLMLFFDAVIFSYGAESDQRLGIPGENLKGSHTATEFVAWYNGHPDYRNHYFDLTCKRVVVIGQGNVAMDVARILCKTTDELKATDIADHALKCLAQSQIEEVHVIGRRGPAQAAFTSEEIKEFGHLADAYPVIDPGDLELNDASRMELENPDHSAKKKNYEIMQSYVGMPSGGRRRKIFLRFLKSPKEIRGAGKVEKIVLENNMLTGEVDQQKAVGTGRFDELDCGLVFRSVGYKGLAMDGVPFNDKRGVIVNDRGRIIAEDGLMPGYYTAGWIKRGPSGVVGTNKPDSEETIQSLMEDVPHLKPCIRPSSAAFESFLKESDVYFISCTDWRKIDAEEVRRGQMTGKPREKFSDIEDMLKAAGK